MAETDQAGPSEQRAEVEQMPYRDRCSGFREIRKRELGMSRPRDFSRRVGGAEALVKRMTQYGKLHGHKGCVNTVCFNSTGDVLVSGSDDKDIIFWDWAMKTKTLSYNSGHIENVFQARIMPFSDDCTVISSAADGQVRVGNIKEDGEASTKQIGSHRGRVHKMAIEPGSSHVFYSCGEDGLVQHFDLRSPSPTRLFTCSSISGTRRVPLNGIVIDPRNPNFFCIGGVDEYARLYDIRKYHQTDPLTDQPVDLFCPNHLIKSDGVHITGLSYSNTSELLVSYNDELIYLFNKDMGIGPDPQSGTQDESEKIKQPPQVYVGHRNAQTVKGPSFFGLKDDYVVSGSDCGHVYIWRKKGGELMCMMNGDKHIVNCIEPHPFFPFLATSGFDKSIKLWTPTATRTAPLPKNAKEVMEANKSGREARSQATLAPDIIMHVLRLQRRQTVAYIERRPAVDHGSDDEDEGREAILVGFSNEHDGEDGDPRECSIS